MRALRLAGLLMVLAFSITLAVVIGLRLSDRAMLILGGVVAGAAASIPVSLIVVTLAQRRREQAGAPRPLEREPEPRVIVIQTPAAPAAASSPDSRPPASFSASPPRPRAFTVIGGDDEDAERPAR